MPSFLAQGGSFFLSDATPAVTVNVPTTGQTYAMAAGQDEMYFNHSATIAALTVKLPPAPKPGDSAVLKFRSVVTTLTVQNAAAVTVTTAPVTATAGQRQEYRYIDNTIGWVYW